MHVEPSSDAQYWYTNIYAGVGRAPSGLSTLSGTRWNRFTVKLKPTTRNSISSPSLTVHSGIPRKSSSREVTCPEIGRSWQCLGDVTIINALRYGIQIKCCWGCHQSVALKVNYMDMMINAVGLRWYVVWLSSRDPPCEADNDAALYGEP